MITLQMYCKPRHRRYHITQFDSLEDLIRSTLIIVQYFIQLYLMGKEDENTQKVDVADLQNGPITEANRQCRDILCCLLFVAMCGIMVYLAAYGYAQGSPSTIFQGVDQNNNVCGNSAYTANGNNYANYPYLYFSNILVNGLSSRVCVNQCPYYNGATIQQVNCPTTSQCTYTVTYTTAGVNSSTPTSTDILGYPSYLLLNRVCIPSSTMFSTAFKSVTSLISSAFSSSDIVNFISDTQNNYYWLLAAAGLALVIAFVFMFLLRCLAGCIVWVSLLGTIAALVGLGLIFLYNSGTTLLSNVSAVTYLGIPGSYASYDAPVGWTLIGVGCGFLIVVLCCCNRIRLAVAICKSAGQFIASVCTIILVPIVQASLALGLWAGCLIAMVYLVSAASFTVNSNSSYFTTIASYSDPALQRFYVFVFGTLWISAFFGAMGIFVVASACCMWYYSHAPGSELSLPVFRSYKMVFRYHWGSLAFGSLLLAIVQFIQLMVELFKRQADASGTSNKCMQYMIKCIECCLACVECIVKFINTQAYIQIALRGKNFCYAAKDGFQLVWSNPLRYTIVGGIGAVIMFLGKLIIAVSTAAGFYLFITYVSSVAQNYTQPLLQVILVAIIGYVVGVLFMTVYSIAMDTLLQCFIVDQTNQKGKGKKAQWAPADLADLMDTEQAGNK